jgi:hypothetical protein
MVHDISVGILHYSSQAFEINDVALAHLRLVVNQKIRKRESFYVNWIREPSAGSGRVTIWVSPDLPIAFHVPELSKADWHPEWVQQMLEEGHSSHGISVRGIGNMDTRKRASPEPPVLAA